MKRLRWLYDQFFHFLTKGKSFSHPEQEGAVHRLIIAVYTTAALMWSYSFNSAFHIDSTLLTYIGFICSTIHFISPLLYKITGSITLATRTFIGAGFIFQFTHGFFTGGFFSNTIIWFSILPLIGGVINGSKELILWSITSIVGVLILFFFNEYTVNIITPLGAKWAQFNISLGYIFLNFALFYSYMYFKEQHRIQLSKKNERIKMFLRIVSHDIANPLMVIDISTRNVQRALDANDLERSKLRLSYISKSAKMISDILIRTQELNELELGKKSLEVSNIEINDIIENALFIFNDKLQTKNINVQYDNKLNKGLTIKVEPISIKNQVFNNLFSNSIKFTEKDGTIQITVTKRGKEIIITYQDNGIGMTEQMLENMFRSDIRTTSLGIDGEPGTGFGMPILKATLQEIGASSEVSSRHIDKYPHDHGTIFTLTFLS